MSIEKQWTVAELIERLEEIFLDDFKLDRTTRIGTLARLMVRQTLTPFLKDNQDVFAWSHEDLPGINPLIMVHRLNVLTYFPPLRQKKQVFALERDRAIAEEVYKLLEVDFIREVYYLN